ncbi:MAG: pseudouridine synthase [Phycisphaerae bacterium]
MAKIRIQKVLSEAGVASRRAVEQMVLDGRVSVNGSAVTLLPCFVDPAADRIRVDGRIVGKRPAERIYLLLNKPRGVVCTQSDPQGRRRAVDLVPEIPGRRVYCVGRLDADSTGLLLLTDDGELTEYLTHPRYGAPKTYVVRIDGVLTGEQIARLKSGVFLDGKRTGGAAVKVLRKSPTQSLIEVTLTEGRNREIRRILLGFGVKVRRLKRVAIGPVTDRGLKIGSSRELRRQEVDRLRRCGRRETKGRRPPARKRPGPPAGGC